MQGRFFTSEDRAGHPKDDDHQPPVGAAIFPGENPLGKHLHVASHGDADYEIVGVVADTLYQVGQPARAAMYVPVLNGENYPGD